MILGIDGGATATKGVLIDAKAKVWARSRGAPSNAVLQNEDQLFAVLNSLAKELATKSSEIEAVALCLAGVVNEKVRHKVEAVARMIWPNTPIFVSHDLRSGLYAGAPSGDGVVVISGTGASVFAKRGTSEIRGGGWGHILGDAGSGYHIAHMGLRNVTAHYDRTAKMSGLGRRMLRATGTKTLEELAAYVSRTEKPRIAELSSAVFSEALKGDRECKRILQVAAAALAANVVAVVKRLGGRQLPILMTGGVFEKQAPYRRLFARELKKVLKWATPSLISEEASLGAARWGREMLAAASPKVSRVKTAQKPRGLELGELLASVRIDQISTEDNNPRTKKLSDMPTRAAVDLFLKEDEIILPALRACADSLTRAVELSATALKSGGRLIYVGAGTSGRLGVLDASECPPTFRSAPGQVTAIIAGGKAALQDAVEGAEDDRAQARVALKEVKISARDCLVGIAASGRTPFVLSALEAAKKRGAATVFLSCNSKLVGRTDTVADVEIHLATGAEVLTGSTRLKAGTATKMALNIISTLSMVRLGKVSGNYMVDLHPSNDKLKVRALRIFMELTEQSSEVAYAALERANWHLRLALKSSGHAPESQSLNQR